jgi:restriction endonuclease Mrr
VMIVSGSRNIKLAQEFITLTINEVLKNAPIHIEPDVVDWGFNPPYWAKLFGKGDDDLGVPVKRPGFSEEGLTDVDPPGISANVVDAFYDEHELSHITAKFLAKKNITKIIEESVSDQGNTAHSAFRLDFVDLALYKALIEHPDLLRSINWRTFEKLLADILESFGYEIELQRGTKDGGVDLFALRKNDALGPQRFLLQAKRWSNKVGVEPVRQLAFLHSHLRVTKACLATTATFTRGAWELAHQYRWQLELRDFNGLQEWIKQAAIIRSRF